MPEDFTILFIRHTSVGVPADLCYGQLDVPLSDYFDSEKQSVRNELNEPPEVILSSPLSRCKKLAGFLAEDIEVRQDARLMELSFGEWEGKRWSELNQKETQTWMEDFVNNRPPGGESFYDLSERARDFWEDLLQLKQDAWVISHQGFIKCLLGLLTGGELQYAIRYKINYGGITRISVSGNMISIDYVNRIGR